MEAQMHSFWRLISLRHLFAEVFVGCLKARALCSPRQPSAERLLQHCPPIRGAGGELPVPWGHPQGSIPSFLPQQELRWWQEWLSLWPLHAQPWPPDSIPPQRAAGSTSTPAALLAFSRWAQLLVPATHVNKEVPWTCAEWIADGSCCWRATSAFSGQSESLTHCNTWQTATMIRHVTSLLALVEYSQQNSSFSSDQCFKTSQKKFYLILKYILKISTYTRYVIWICMGWLITVRFNSLHYQDMLEAIGLLT